MRGRGEHSARRIRWQALFAAAGRNQWCACRRSASLLYDKSGAVRYAGGARAFLPWRGKTRMRRRIARTKKNYPPPRKRGRGDHASASEAWWRGPLRWSFVAVAGKARMPRRDDEFCVASPPAPLPPRQSAVPLPRFPPTRFALRRTQTRRSSPSERRRVAGQDGSSRLGGETHEHHGALTSPCVARRCGATRDTTKERDRRRPRAPARA